MGVPTLVIITAENQEWIGRYLERECAAIDLKWFHNLTVESLASQCTAYIYDQNVRNKFLSQAQKLVGCFGVDEIINVMLKKEM